MANPAQGTQQVNMEGSWIWTDPTTKQDSPRFSRVVDTMAPADPSPTDAALLLSTAAAARPPSPPSPVPSSPRSPLPDPQSTTVSQSAPPPPPELPQTTSPRTESRCGYYLRVAILRCSHLCPSAWNKKEKT